MENEAKELEIQAEVAEIKHQVEKLQEGIVHLRERTNSVMRPSDPDKTDEAENKGAYTPLGQQLHVIRYDIRAVNGTIADILARLEV